MHRRPETACMSAMPLSQMDVVVREMLADRGFVIDEDKYDRPMQTCDTRPTLSATNEEGKRCHVYWLDEAKLGIRGFRSIMDMHESEADLHTMIIICECGKTSFAERSISNTAWRVNISIFKTEELQYNVTKHALVPKHVKCTHAEVLALSDHFKLHNKHSLPYLLQSDPISRYYDFKKGDIIRIERVNAQQELQNYFRLVID